MAARDGGVTLQWSSIAAIGVLMATIIGGSWTLVQSQFNASTAREDLRHSDTNRRLDEFRDGFRRVDREIDRHAGHFIRIEEFRQFQMRLEQMQKQLSVLESTRPTTGELQAVSRSLEKRIEMIESKPR